MHSSLLHPEISPVSLVRCEYCLRFGMFPEFVLLCIFFPSLLGVIYSSIHIFIYACILKWDGTFSCCSIRIQCWNFSQQGRLFSWIKTLPVCSDHCKAMGCRIGVTVVLGEVDAARVKPCRSGPSAHGRVRTPPASGGRQPPGSD